MYHERLGIVMVSDEKDLKLNQGSIFFREKMAVGLVGQMGHMDAQTE